ncbi:hypothetical protein C7120_02760 [Prevotella sp. oral taxon 376]|uniref:hypothetical protein n=1 Tax=Prevotella sp. oral taxon 376 TaxID=712466 RepID=UPI000D1F058E|nr:hypothetical protein [Prevotella sp. oral taxon 376]PTL33551.1 hypothetical protein C7120_02760 [Prevotella sp. oral taxon 376]
MKNWQKVGLLVAFHGLMMTDYYIWDTARLGIKTFKSAQPAGPTLHDYALHQVDRLGWLLFANVLAIGLLVVWLCLRRKRAHTPV